MKAGQEGVQLFQLNERRHVGDLFNVVEGEIQHPSVEREGGRNRRFTN